MAPGLSSLCVYVGSTDTAIFNAMATAHPLNAQLSSSWTWSPADPSTDDPYFQEFAAQGQNLFQAAGDSGAWTSTSAIYPADDVYVTSVGGTDLTTSSAGGAWSSETAWVDGGGGISPDQFRFPPGRHRGCWLLELFQNLSQRPGRFGEREFHLLRLRRPNHLHGQRIWRNQFCRADVGRLPGSGQSAGGCQHRQPGRLHQSDHLSDRLGLQLYHRFPRHHQRQQRLFGHNRVRSGHRLGQSERRRPDQCPGRKLSTPSFILSASPIRSPWCRATMARRRSLPRSRAALIRPSP